MDPQSPERADGASPPSAGDPDSPGPENDEEPEAIAPEVERLAPPAYAARHPPVDDGPRHRPSPVFLGVVAVTTLVADVGSKIWAEHKLESMTTNITLIPNHLSFVLAKNRGGAWGLLQSTSENVRRPFFLLVSAAAIAFIVTLYRRLQRHQRALKWGLPLVLGGALGNVFDRIRYGHVIDFIDYRADWLRAANAFVAKYDPDHVVTDHWPTFNVADVAICVGVALMAIDMFTARRGYGAGRTIPPPPPPSDPPEDREPRGTPETPAHAEPTAAPPVEP